MSPTTATAGPIVYPDSDGQPMAENTLQFEWIVTIKGGLDAVFAHDPTVFVAGDLLWYPVQGEPKIRLAPDTLVAFGRPKGYRGSYRQWEEGGIAPQVVFEVLSPGNRFGEMLRKFNFYEDHGVEEYYVFDPEEVELFGWRRVDGKLQPIVSTNGFTSPLLNIRFELGADLRIIGPDGRQFATYVELVEQRALAEREKEQLEREKAQAEREKAQAERETDEVRRHADEQARALEKLRIQLKAMGIEPEV